ncbi:glycosyltransferase family 2 protein [candidate division WWE3 bacterium]|jgi:glycosyltransferase involved in cell wall biosynthesis|uniref:Glycosyltransferase family 2 protein n=1 Tax=candidate division WWE3 bacterium TaxID=2053526 RepID=A0A3A4ZGK2_UNCKA|nr:MAG: glycosyltransferase family 2 protein [candidate division WWE3 bacterium]
MIIFPARESESMQKITLLIPCHNEESGLGKVLEQVPYEMFKKIGFEIETIVIDNNSTDKTSEIAKSFDIKVIHEKKQGKGNALVAGFNAVSSDTKYIVMMDGDNTYKPHEMLRLIEPLHHDFCDVVVGSRLSGKMLDNSLRFSNRLANWGYTFLVRQFYFANVTDVLSGYFAWKKSAIDDLVPHIKSNGFSIEMEMITKMVRLGHDIASVPITYDKREGETKINPFRDGVNILFMFFRNLFWKPRNRTREKVTTLKISNLANPEFVEE